MRVISRIYLAGAEASTLSDLLEDQGVVHILYSYWPLFIKRMQRAIIDRVLRGRDEGRQYVLDSGAYTYQAAAVHQERPIPFEKYQHSYYKFVATYGHLFNFCAELDLESTQLPGREGVVTVEDVWKWRDELMRLNPKARIMPIWHPETRTRGEWTYLCKNPAYPFLGIGGQAGLRNQYNLGLYNVLLSEAHRHNKIVHGYGATKIKTMLQILKYDSVDSTSWIASQKYGTTYIFAQKKWTVLDNTQKSQRRRFRRHFTNKGIDWKKLEADDTPELRKSAVIAWRDLSEHMIAKRVRFASRWAAGIDNLSKAQLAYEAQLAKAHTEVTLQRDLTNQGINPLAQNFAETTMEEAFEEYRYTDHNGEERVLKIPKSAPPKDPSPGALSGPKNVQPTTQQANLSKPPEAPTYPNQNDGGDPHRTPLTAPESQNFARPTGTPDSPTIITQSDTQTTPNTLGLSPQTHPSLHPTASARTKMVKTDTNTPPGQDLMRLKRHMRPNFVTELNQNKALLSGLPQLRCNNCGVSDSCPQFDENRPNCAFEVNMGAYPVRDSDNILQLAEHIVGDNKVRYMRARMFEDISEGGMPNDKTTQLSGIVLDQLNKLKQMREDLDDSIMEDEEQNKSEGGILQQMLARMTQTNTAEIKLTHSTPPTPKKE